MNFIKKAGLAMVLAAMPALGFAQSTTTAPTVRAVVFSEVNFANVSVATTTETIRGSYTLTSDMGKQNGINIGIIAQDNTTKLAIDAVTLSQNVSIQQGEKKTFSYSYTIPRYLKGNVTFFLKAETNAGLTVATSKLETTDLSGAGFPVSCEIIDTAKGTITCTASEATTAQISYSKGSTFGARINETTKDFKKGEKYSFTPDLPAGRYVVHVGASKESGAVFSYTAPGVYGTISSFVVSSGTQGVLHTVVVVQTSDKDASLALTLKDTSGAICMTNTQKVGMGPIVFDTPSTCAEGTASIELVSGTGEKLDSKTESFSIRILSPATTTTNTTMSHTTIMYALLGLIVLVVLAYLYIRSKGRSKPVLVAAMLLVFLSGGINRVHATGADLFFYCPLGVIVCPEATALHISISPAGGPFYPGSTVGVETYISSDDNPQYPDRDCGQVPCVAPLVKIALAMDSATYNSADLFPTNLTVSQTRSGQYGTSVNTTAPATLGTHYINWSIGASGYQTVTGSTPVTIQSAAVPVVDVHFSLLQKLFGVFAAETPAVVGQTSIRPACITDDNGGSCTYAEDSNLGITVYEGSPEQIVGSSSISVMANQDVAFTYADIVKNVGPGTFRIVGWLTVGDQEVGHFEGVYTNPGAPVAPEAPVSSWPITLNQALTGLVALIAIFLSLIAWILHRHHHVMLPTAGMAPPVSPVAPPVQTMAQTPPSAPVASAPPVPPTPPQAPQA
jgi:hypothetical protein